MPDEISVAPLAGFSRPVAAWFAARFGQPTEPQVQGWAAIQRGEHALILAPTGSGKTLAAFLWAIDRIYRELADPARADVHGVRLLYVSPLKALNNDIERNLAGPLEGIRATAQKMGLALPPVRVAVRTGDTPGHVRSQMVQRPPHILITTPESLYLMLTSPRAREMFRTVQTVIVDEIHTLSGNKRGVHLSLTLERLVQLAGEVQRIGLSATQKPLEEVARFLGGQTWQPAVEERQPPVLAPRPVTIVNTGYRKQLDLQVVTVVDSFNELPGATIWPSVITRLTAEIWRHRTTLIFANNRRLAERTADRLNAQITAERNEEIPPGSLEVLAPGGVARDRGMFAIGASGPIRAHHGSVSKEARHQMEEDLKAGRLPALVGTSSLELGIDIGTVDLVAQLQSPKSVSQGLQRVGRSGHLVGKPSVGRIFATFREDLVEAAAVARGMLEGDVEPTYTPRHPLDVLAQQIVAMVAVEDWEVDALYDRIRQAYAYWDLSRASFEAVLAMLSGRYYDAFDDPATKAAGPAVSRLISVLRPRISWDRVNNRLSALPGSRLLAVSNAGTIPDTGAYGVYLSDGQTKIGELDEEFVFETRQGDAFMLGSHVWRVLDIQDDRIVVGDAGATVPRMPFWNGDYPWRPYELGRRIGRFRGELAIRVHDALARATADTAADAPEAAEARARALALVMDWLSAEYKLDAKSATNLVDYVQNQLNAIGVMSSERIIVAEVCRDAVGELRLILHSPFGGRVNAAWALALRNALRERLHSEPEMQANDDGILLRLGDVYPALPVELVQRMTPAEAHERVLAELPGSAVFGAQFRMAASRALLLPRAHGQRRTPFWLQRLKAKDLLSLVSGFGDFPIVAETYRACLEDVLDMTHLEEVLAGIQAGEISVVPVETAVPSPIAADLLFYFMNTYMYEWDVPKAERNLQALAMRREVLDDVLHGTDLSNLLRPEAIAAVTGRLQHRAAGYRARSREELAVILQEVGDLPVGEVGAHAEGDAAGWLAELAGQGRVAEMTLPTAGGPLASWVPEELAGQYRAAFGLAADMAGAGGRAAESVLRRFLRQAGPITRAGIVARYAFPDAWLDATLDRLVAERALARGHFSPAPEAAAPEAAPAESLTAAGSAAPVEYCDSATLEEIHRQTLSILRREVQAVDLPAYAAFLARWQHLHPEDRLSGPAGLATALEQLAGVRLPLAIWEREALPGRVAGFMPAALEALCQSGDLVWVAADRDVVFFGRGEGRLYLPPAATGELSPAATEVYDYLKEEGASFIGDLQAGLGRAAPAIQAALAELVAAGLVTNDTLAALRAAQAAGQNGAGGEPAEAPSAAHVAPPPARPLSALENELAERRGQPPGTSRPVGLRPSRPASYADAKRRVARRMEAAASTTGATAAGPRVPEATAAASGWAGRWSLVQRTGVLGREQAPDEIAARQANVLLARYGVVSRDCLAHESAAFSWPAIYAELQRLEMRGKVRRGYFVAGLAGAQFALPEAVERLRAATAADAALMALTAMDPANPYGGEAPPAAPGEEAGVPEIAGVAEERGAGQDDVPAWRFARVPSTALVLQSGRPVLLAEDNGRRISAANVPAGVLRAAAELYLARPAAPRHLVVAQWNGQPAWSSPGEAVLKPLGFYRTPAGLEWWRGG